MNRREELLAFVSELRAPDPRVLMTDVELTDALLPLVDRLCAEAAAEALTDAADATGAIVHGDDVRDVLRARAAALTETKEADRG